MDADNLHKTDASMEKVFDYMHEIGVSRFDMSWRSLGTYDGVPVVVRYIHVSGEAGSPESYGIPF